MLRYMEKRDRAVRVLLAVLLGAAAYLLAPLSSGALDWLALAVAAVLLGTSFLGIRRLDWPFGFSTRGRH